jgi:hypothetical protein
MDLKLSLPKYYIIIKKLMKKNNKETSAYKIEFFFKKIKH